MRHYFYYIGLSVIFAAVTAVPLSAQQTNFSFTPPPIPYYTFEKGDVDMKAGGTALYMTGDIDDPSVSGEVSVYGGGANFFYRNAFRNRLAFDLGAAVVGAKGDIGDSASMSMAMLVVPVGLEFMAMKNPSYTLIVFGGWDFSWTYIGIEAEDAGITYDFEIWTSLKGPHVGIQLNLVRGDFVFSPFFMMSKLAGDAEITLKEDGTEILSGSTHVSADIVKNFGLDIYYQPWDMTLSSLLQMAADNEYTTYYFTVSYHFRSGGDDDTAGKEGT